MKLWVVLGAGIFFALIAGVAVCRLEDHDLDRRANDPFAVTVSGKAISGTIWRPDGAVIAAVAMVHGDGEQDRTMSGGYAPMINALLDRGIAVVSWDKPGVGASEGNWLQQTMSDRTDETRSVLDFMRARFEGAGIGALGFSQAGWVLPSLTRADADFIVLIGAAVSWQAQGDYYTRQRLRGEGVGEQQIQSVLAAQRREDDRLFGIAATADDAPAGMSPDRWRFIRQNRQSDAREALSKLELPVLALWGAEDLNVDPYRNAATFEDMLGGRETATLIRIVPGATHGLLKAPAYNWQLSQDWSTYAYGRFLMEGRHAFAPGALDEIADWVRDIARTR
jgi:pimeloyl-ACP methyl ester carboxylesterase